MTLTRLRPMHDICREPILPVTFYVSSDRRLVVEGLCTSCEQTVSVGMTLTELENSVPQAHEITAEDGYRLRGLGVATSAPLR